MDRVSQVLTFDVPTDRAALGRLAQSLALDGGLTDGAEARFGKEISVEGLAMLLRAHFADVTQTALAAMAPRVQRRALAKLYYQGNDGRKRNAAQRARANLLATVEHWQNRLREQMAIEGKVWPSAVPLCAGKTPHRSGNAGRAS